MKWGERTAAPDDPQRIRTGGLRGPSPRSNAVTTTRVPHSFTRSESVAVARPVLVLATMNRSKVLELTQLLGHVGHEIRPLADSPGAALPEETEETYAGNALLKAALRSTSPAAACSPTTRGRGGRAGRRSRSPFGALRRPRTGRRGPGAPAPRRAAGRPSRATGGAFRCAIALLAPGGGARFTEGVVEARSPRPLAARVASVRPGVRLSAAGTDPRGADRRGEGGREPSRPRRRRGPSILLEEGGAAPLSPRPPALVAPGRPGRQSDAPCSGGPRRRLRGVRERDRMTTPVGRSGCGAAW